MVYFVHFDQKTLDENVSQQNKKNATEPTILGVRTNFHLYRLG